jgi:hypothetical protein
MARREEFSVGKLIGGPNGEVSRFLKSFSAIPVAAVNNRYVLSTNMINGAYSLANQNPGDGLARNVTVTHTTATGTDTLGTITVVGKDINGHTISEVITPLADQTVQGAKAFAQVASITGAGWVINGGNDTIVVGFGDIVGLPDVIAAAADVILVAVGTGLLNAPSVGVGAALCQNTVTATGANGTNRLRVLYQI